MTRTRGHIRHVGPLGAILLLLLMALPMWLSAAPRAAAQSSLPTNVTGSWAAVASLPNTSPRYDPVAATEGKDGRIYTVGTLVVNGAYQAQLASYTPASDSWTLLPPLPTDRDRLALATGADGRIYAIGGESGDVILNTVEVYNPTSQVWTTAAPLPTARWQLAAATDSAGRIYAIGGCPALNPCGDDTIVERYDPATNTWSTLPKLLNGRSSLAAATGPDGRVYAVGGWHNNNSVNWVEAFTPATGAWAVASPLPNPRTSVGATFGTDGRMYAVGGTPYSDSTTEVDVYTPSGDSWGVAPPLPQSRLGAAVAADANGHIYAMGGINQQGKTTVLSTAVALTVTGTTTAGSPACRVASGIPLPATGAWAERSPLCLARSQVGAAAGPGPDGATRIYAFGGNEVDQPFAPNRAEAYDPRSDAWTELPSMPISFAAVWAAAGADGRIYAFGGTFTGGYSVLAYDPKGRTWATAPGMPGAVAYNGAVARADGRIYAVGSATGNTNAYMFGLFDPSASAWTALAPLPFYNGTALAVGGDGRVYLTGFGGIVEVYDPGSNAWSGGPLLHTFRGGSAATAGADGRVYVLGGAEEIQGTLASGEAYTPGASGWSAISPMPTARGSFGAATDSNGRIYAIGGSNASGGLLATVEVYTPAPATALEPSTAGVWTTGAQMPTYRMRFAVTTGADGRVYALGGETYDPSSSTYLYQATAEAYDASANAWIALPPMPTARAGLAAVPGTDGRVYAIGGYSFSWSTGSQYYRNVEAFDPRTSTWATLAPLPATALSIAATQGADGMIYVIGYAYGSGWLAAYSPATNAWTQLGAVPRAREGSSAVLGPDGRIYAIGGDIIDSRTRAVGEVDAYDPRNRSWSTVAPLLLARANPGVALGVGTGGKRIYVIGGGIGTVEFGDLAPSYSVETYDSTANAWTEAASVPIRRTGATAATLPDGRIVSMGGLAAATEADTFTPPGWQRPPPPAPLAARYASMPPTAWSAGQTQTYQVTVTNTGSQTWNATGANPVHLGIHFVNASGGWLTDQRFVLPADVASGASATLTVSVTAPSAAGGATLTAQMVKELVAWFPQTQQTAVSVAVAAPPLAATYTSTPPTTWTAGQAQTYQIMVTNTGSQSWNAAGSNPVHLGVHFVNASGGWLSDQRFILPNDVAPGASVTIAAAVTAPSITGGETLTAQLVKEMVAWFPQSQQTSVTVSNPLTALAASYASTPPTAWTAGQSQTYQVSVTNTGSQPWNASGTNPVHLGVHFVNAAGGWLTDQRFTLPNDVAAGASATLTVNVTGPSAAGSLTLTAQMVKELVAWFPQTEQTSVTVSAPAGPALAASYSSSPPTTWTAGQTQTYQITITNSGSQTWNASGANPVHLGIHFVNASGTWLTDQRFVLPGDVAPGASATLTVSVTAPSAAGSYTLTAQMVKEMVAWFPQSQQTAVSVQ